MATIIGFDPGFGNAKAATIKDNKVQTAIVPSVVGVGDTDLGLLGEMMVPTQMGRRRTVPDRVALNGVAYLVGENVVQYSRPVERMDFRRLSTGAELRALFYATLYRLLGSGEHRDLALMIGLPVEVMMDGDLARATRKELQGWLVGEHTYEVNGEKVTLEIPARDRVGVLAQPAGTYWAWTMRDDGTLARSPEEMQTSVAIADVGFNTLDLFTMKGKEIVRKYTGGDTAGMRRAAEVVSRTVRQKYSITLSLHEADALVRARLPEIETAKGMVDLCPVTEQARDAVASAIVSLIEQHWGNARQFRHVLFTGGGSEMLRKELTQQHPYATVVSDAVVSNAIGLAKFGRIAFK